ncbi:MAG TPA: metal-dependent hydrolase [Rubrobacter sp.]|nr:metal-dependent hydrolase [Rubrobacter sp.]
MQIFAFETPRAAGLLFALNATTHAIFGVAALAGVSLLTGNEPPLYAYPAAVVAAWLPDVDNPRSRLGNGLSRTKVPVLDVISRPVSWALRITSFTLFRTVGHRTLTHSLLGVALFAVLISPVAPLSPELFLALLTGYISHLFADALNMRGVPLMWPVKWTFRLLPRGVKSGGVTELLVAFVVAVAAGFEVYALHLAGAFSSGVL